MVPKRKAKAQQTLPLFASAMRSQSPAEELVRVEGRPARISTGLRGLDETLGGGFPVGALTWVAERPDSGVLGLLLGSALKNAKRKWSVAIASDRRGDHEIQQRVCAIEAKVHAFRFAAGLASAEDRIAMVAARKRVPWKRFAILSGRAIDPKELDELLFTYRPLLLVADLRPRAPNATRHERLDSYHEGLVRLASLARRHQCALVLLDPLRASSEPADLGELPARGSLAKLARTVVLASPAGTGLALSVPRRDGGWLDVPDTLRLRQDVRFDRARG